MVESRVNYINFEKKENALGLGKLFVVQNQNLEEALFIKDGIVKSGGQGIITQSINDAFFELDDLRPDILVADDTVLGSGLLEKAKSLSVPSILTLNYSDHSTQEEVNDSSGGSAIIKRYSRTPEWVEGLDMGLLDGVVNCEDVEGKYIYQYGKNIINSRKKEKLEDIQHIGAMEISMSSRVAQSGEGDFKFTDMEWRLLNLFLENRGRGISHNEIVAKCFGAEYFQDSPKSSSHQYVRTWMSKLRKKLGNEARNIVNDVGRGYMLK